MAVVADAETRLKHTVEEEVPEVALSFKIVGRIVMGKAEAVVGALDEAVVVQ